MTSCEACPENILYANENIINERKKYISEVFSIL